MSHVNPSDPTQVSYPWKATARTLLAAVVAILTVAPIVIQIILDQWDVEWLGAVLIQVIAVQTVVTRVMAIEAVNNFLTRFGLGATPR
jgi:hypothetical protein